MVRRRSAVRWVGWFASRVALVLLIYPTVVALSAKTSAVFIVPLRVAAHLEYWGVPLNRIVELDWCKGRTVKALSIALAWTEPVERRVVAAELAQVSLLTPRPREGAEPALGLPTSRWWPSVPWQTVAQHPIVSSQVPN